MPGKIKFLKAKLIKEKSIFLAYSETNDTKKRKFGIEDPVIIGQVIRKDGWNKRIVSFMIAWHLNTNMI